MRVVTEQTLRVNGLDFNLAEAGDGPPVLLLHGFPDSWRLWRHQISALAHAGHRVIGPDLPACGDSASPPPAATRGSGTRGRAPRRPRWPWSSPRWAPRTPTSPGTTGVPPWPGCW